MSFAFPNLLKEFRKIIVVHIWGVLLGVIVLLIGVLSAMFFSPWGIDVATRYKPVGDFVGAFATPLIAAIVAYIAVYQYRVSRRQLQLARYERQKPVYTATYNYLHAIKISGVNKLPIDIMKSFTEAIHESHFIFDGDEVSSYLDELKQKELDLARLYRQLKSKRFSAQERERFLSKSDDLDDWFQKQYTDGARQVFLKHLKLQ